MNCRDWFVTNEGDCQPRPSARDWDLIREKYYFHQFLTEIMEILREVNNELEEWDRLPQIRMRVRQLVMNSYWLRTRYMPPKSATGASVMTLYDEIGYPLTVQNVTFSPGTMSPIHNHGTWGVVEVIEGEEEHTFWRRVPDEDNPDRIELVGRKVLSPGELISFMPGAIHQVKAVASEPTVTFCLYGATHPRSRFQFDPVENTAKQF